MWKGQEKIRSLDIRWWHVPDNLHLLIAVNPANLYTFSQSESLVYQAERQLKELGDKVPGDLKSSIESKIADLRSAAQADDVGKMKRTQETLQQELIKIGQSIYGSGGSGVSSGGQEPQAGAAAGSRSSSRGGGSDEPDVIDADFTDSTWGIVHITHRWNAIKRYIVQIHERGIVQLDRCLDFHIHTDL